MPRTAADLAGLITPDRIRRTLEMAARCGLDHRKCRRILAQSYAPPTEGEHAIKARDFPAFEISVATMDEASRMLAEDAEIMEAVRAFFADQNERRTAPVLRLVPRPDPAPVLAQPSARGVLARAFTGLFGGRAAKVA